MTPTSRQNHLAPEVDAKFQLVADTLGVTRQELNKYLNLQCLEQNQECLRVTEEMFQSILGPQTKIIEQIVTEIERLTAESSLAKMFNHPISTPESILQAASWQNPKSQQSTASSTVPAH